MKFLFSITTSFHNFWLTTAAVQEGGHAGWGWCSIWLWLFPLCFCHRSNVLCDAIDWLEYSSHHSEVCCLISKTYPPFVHLVFSSILMWLQGDFHIKFLWTKEKPLSISTHFQFFFDHFNQSWIQFHRVFWGPVTIRTKKTALGKIDDEQKHFVLFIENWQIQRRDEINVSHLDLVQVDHWRGLDQCLGENSERMARSLCLL